MTKTKPRITDFVSACRYIMDGHSLLYRRIDKSTVVRIPFAEGSSYAWIEYHGTRIITYHHDGTIIIDFNGFHTLTTRKRVREYTGYSCSSAGREGYSLLNGVLVIRKAKILTDGTVLPFEGMEGVWV